MSEQLISSSPVLTHAGQSRIFGLDLLRAAAILSVICAHGFVVLYPHFGAALGIFGHGGFYGVELFFVLSGFLIGQVLLRQAGDGFGAADVATFYVRRWFRTLPLFFFFVAVNVWIEWSFRNHRVGTTEVLTQAFFLRNLTAVHLSFFPESWSLAVEEWFYLLFPAALWCGMRFSRSFDRVLCITAVLFLVASTLARTLGASAPDATWAVSQRMVVVYRFDALMMGVFAAWLATRFRARWEKERFRCAAFGTILLIAMYTTLWKFENGRLAFGDDDYFARTFRFTCVSLGFALLLPICSRWRLHRETFLTTAVRRLALWSYALYLVHLPVVSFVTGWAWLHPERSVVRALCSFAAQICGAVAISAFLYRFLEAPCTRLRERFAPALKARSEGHA